MDEVCSGVGIKIKDEVCSGSRTANWLCSMKNGIRSGSMIVDRLSSDTSMNSVDSIVTVSANGRRVTLEAAPERCDVLSDSGRNSDVSIGVSGITLVGWREMVEPESGGEGGRRKRGEGKTDK